MKQNILKRITAFVLVIVMCAGFAACGSTKDSAGNANSALAKEYVHSYTSIDFGDFGENSNVNIQKMDYSGGRIYTLLDIYIYEEQGTTARTEEASVDLAMAVDPGFGVVPDTEWVEPQYIKRVVSFLPDGTDMKQVDLEMSEELNNGYSYLDSNTISFANGNVYGKVETWISDYSDPENPIEENRQEIVCWGEDGARKWTVNIGDFVKSEDPYQYYYISSMRALSDGTVSIVLNADQVKLLSMDTEGSLVSEQTIGSGEMNINYTFIKDDGSVLFTLPNDNWTEMYAAVFDPVTGVMGEKVLLPGNLMNYSLSVGTAVDLIAHNNQGIYVCNIGDTEIRQIMSYINSDLDANYINSAVMIDEEHLVLAYTSMDDYEQEIVVTAKVDPEDIPDKRVLVLAGKYIAYNLRKRVFDFNKTSEKYRIALRDYSTYNTNADYTLGQTQLNSDIISGDIPDILVVDNSVDMQNYISKGIFTDINTLLENDPELSQKEFMQNVFDAYSVDGKLYQVIPSFTVNTLIGKKSLVGDVDGWNMDEFLEVLEKMPEGTRGFGDYTRDSFIRMVLQFCGTEFIDMETGKCSFNSAEFVRMLEYAKTLPVSIEYGEDYDWEANENQYRNEKTLLMPLYIYAIRDVNYYIYGEFGEDVSFVGFPNESKNGSVINIPESYAISAQSKDIDGAWEFVRYYLTDEYQSSDEMYQMPVSKEAFAEKAKAATERPFYWDENGEKVEYDDYVYINGESIILPPMSQEKVDEVVAFIESVDRASYFNQDIINIIQEDVAPFFAGQKTAQEVADIIQNRVQIIVNDR